MKLDHTTSFELLLSHNATGKFRVPKTTRRFAARAANLSAGPWLQSAQAKRESS